MPEPAPLLELQSIARAFAFPGEVRTADRYGSGHINDTYRVACAAARGAESLFILQRINHRIFKQPVALMENIRRATTHLGGKLAGRSDRSRRVLQLVPARTGASCHQDAQGGYWRAYLYIAQARTFDAVESPAQARAAARAFGRFQALLADLPDPALHETIPDFHNTPKRYAAFEAAVSADVAGRAALARPEIEFARRRAAITRGLLDAGLPQRVTHNDTKLNNVLIDEMTGEGICVIDLDTLMPGLALYDFGDMVRTATSPAVEDERDLSKVTMQFPMFEALVRGYLEEAGGFLTPAERGLLAFSGKLITFEIGLRFLTDFLSGDVYFRVHREHHNLDRCRTQFRLVESIEEQEARMTRFVEDFG